MLPPAATYFLKIPQPLQTATTGEELFEPLSLWVAFLSQTLGMCQFVISVPSRDSILECCPPDLAVVHLHHPKPSQVSLRKMFDWKGPFTISKRYPWNSNMRRNKGNQMWSSKILHFQAEAKGLWCGKPQQWPRQAVLGVEISGSQVLDPSLRRWGCAAGGKGQEASWGLHLILTPPLVRIISSQLSNTFLIWLFIYTRHHSEGIWSNLDIYTYTHQFSCFLWE